MPFYLCDLTVPITAEAATSRMRGSVGPPRYFPDDLLLRFDTSVAITPLFGTVQAESFWVWRRITYRNAFLPIVWGRTIHAPTGIRIRLAMFLNPIGAVFALAWLSMTGVFALLSVAAQGGVKSWDRYVPAAMFVVGLVLVCASFFPEAIKVKRLIEDILAETSA
jgi:hypothetical protein